MASAELTYSTSYDTDPKQHPGYIEDASSKLSSLPVAYKGNTFNLRTLYDIVSWILSVVGTVPGIATKENYYFPLMMIGYVFSSKLIPAKPNKKGGRPKPSAGPPAVWSVMWFKQMVGNSPITRVLVGATLDQPGKSTKDNAKDFRKGLLKASQILEWNQALTPVQLRSPNRTGQDFGHCAETYPLLFICS